MSDVANTGSTAAQDTDTVTATPVVPGSSAYFQTWVPFVSGYLTPGTSDSSSDVALGNTAYSATYGLLNPFQSQPMGSFLHLGATDPDMLNPATATDIATDAQKVQTYTNAAALLANATGGGPGISGFTDDYRYRGDLASRGVTSITPPNVLQRESQLLLAKGGWRDHTDGNRITTTGGDKVEVVGGNSLLIILGRPATDNAGGHVIESSGGFSYDNDAGPGHVEEIRWVPNLYSGNGTWMVREKNYMCDEVSIGSGAVREAFVGSVVEVSSGDAVSYHGRLSDIPSALQGDTTFNPPASIARDEQIEPDFPYENDLATAEDFITSIQRNAAATFGSSVGSTSAAPSLTEQSQNIREYAVVDSMYSNTHVKGNVQETTTVDTFATATSTISQYNTETTKIGGANTSTTAIGGVNTETTAIGGDSLGTTTVAGATQEITAVGGNILGIEVCATKVDLAAYVGKASFELSPAALDIWVGFLKRDVVVGDAQEYGFDNIKFNTVGTIGAAGALTISSLVSVTINSAIINIGGAPVDAAALATSMATTFAALPAVV